MKIHTKIIYLLIAIFVIYTLVFSGFIYYSISNYAFTDFYKRLEIRAAFTAKIQLEEHHASGGLKEIKQEFMEELPSQRERIYSLTRDTAIPLPEEVIEQAKEEGVSNFNNDNTFFTVLRYKTKNDKQYLVVVSAENYFYTHHISYLKNLFLSSLVYILLFIILLSVVISRSLTLPLMNIIKELKKIGSENLHLRLQTPRKNDTLAKLRGAFNEMLNRLETSFETQKNFISNASHELNTPLTAIIGEADWALNKDRSEQEYRDALDRILQEADKLAKKTTALLYLARTGFDGKKQPLSPVRIDQLLLDVIENLKQINQDYQILIDFSLLPEDSDNLTVTGNDVLLQLALSNIIINGCKYSDNRPVTLALGASDSEIILLVKDQGIGIPQNEMKYIYDPYYRATNTNDYEGYGIGLPLSRNIILLHKGSLNLSSEINKGTTVEIKLPIAGTFIS